MVSLTLSLFAVYLTLMSCGFSNAGVDIANAAFSRSRSSDAVLAEEHAELRRVAGVPSPDAVKFAASFYHKTGVVWRDRGRFEVSSACFGWATSSVSDDGGRKLLLDLRMARARTSCEVSDRNFAIALLNRAKNLLFGSPEHHKLAANHWEERFVLWRHFW